MNVVFLFAKLYFIAIVLYLIVVFAVAGICTFLSRKKLKYVGGYNALQFQGIKRNKFYLLSFEYHGGGYCDIVATHQSHQVDLDPELESSSYVFIMDDQGSVIQPIRGENVFASNEISDIKTMAREVERFWRVREEYE